MDTTIGLSLFDNEKYLTLETFRRDGTGVRTPVWFATAQATAGERRLYVYTTADSGKAKRLRRTPAVRLAPCDARGRVTGAWVDAEARIDAGAFDAGMALLNKKYWPWKQILDLSVRLFPRHQRIMIVIERATRTTSATTTA